MIDSKIEQDTLVSVKDLKWIGRSLLKNWYLFILFPILFGALGKYNVYKMVSQYKAQVQILLKSNDVYDYQNSINSNIGFYNYYGDILNQTRILKSYDLIERTLEKLDFKVSYFIEGRVKTKEVFEQTPFIVDISLLNNSLYEQVFKFNYIDNENYQLSFSLGGEVITNKHKFGEKAYTNFYVIEVNNNSFLSESGLSERALVNYQFVVHSKNFWVNQVLRGLQVENVEYTSILDISLVDPIPQRGKKFLDTLSSEYIKYTLENQLFVNENTLNFIQKQLDEVISVLEKITLEIEVAREKKGVLNLEKESTIYFDQLISFETSKRTLELDINALDNLREYILSVNDDNLMPPSFYILENDPYLKKALAKFYETQSSKVDLIYKVKEGHQDLERLKESIVTQKKDILIYINNTKEAIKEKIKDVIVEIAYFEKLVKKIPKTERDMLSINRRLQVNEKLYMFLLEKRANTFIAKSGIVPQTKVIEKARVVGAVGGNLNNILFGYIFGGILLAFIITFVKAIFFYKYEDVKDLTENTSIPVLGSLPLVKELDFDLPAKSAITESLRMIRTSLSYLSSNISSKVFMVTSIHPGEGKTFTSSRLAMIYAMSGKKVLLIDFDMHKPRVHQYLGLKNLKGSSTILSGKGQINDCIQGFKENLDVITSGPIPPNASELILSELMDDLIIYGRDNYDYVFLDTPPIGFVSDGVVLLSKVDVATFVMNTKKSNKKGVQFLEKVIQQSKIEHTGLVLNGVKQTKWKYYYGKYGYGYGYGYGEK